MPRQGHLYRISIVILLTGVAVAGRSPETDLAAPGAALYQIAVDESVKGMMSKQQQAEDAQSRPPSPGPDYYWCKNCKTYHKRPSRPSSQGQQAGAQRPGTAPVAAVQTNTVAVTRPPSPGPDYYWCEKCKTFHRRQPLSQQSVEDLILGRATNSPNLNPLTSPAGEVR